jgi:hypothetical protein
VVKRFAFNFVNQFSVLFHAAFWQRDLHRVRTLSFYAFISHAVSQKSAIFLPCLSPFYARVLLYFLVNRRLIRCYNKCCHA